MSSRSARGPDTASPSSPYAQSQSSPPSSQPSSSPSQSSSFNANAHAHFSYGVLPALPEGTVLPDPTKPPSTNAATGATAASVRALTSQAIAFYFRAPVKAFFRTRVDYLAYARTIQEQHHAASSLAKTLHGLADGAPLAKSGLWPWLRETLRTTTPGVLASAVKHNGWRVLPDQVLPPLVANVGVGAVLYTSYLQILGRLHEGSGRASKRVYPPPSPAETFMAGLLAGGIQSVVAAPLDAIQARYDHASIAAGLTGSGNPTPKVAGAASGMAPAAAAAAAPSTPNVNGRPQSMWAFSYAKLREIGLRGIFAGWGLSLAKDSIGSAVFFSTFEYVKAQSYYRFVTWYYGALSEDIVVFLSKKRPTAVDAQAADAGMPRIIRPHYAIEPAFLLLAGVAASLAQSVVVHPLSHIQTEHWDRLEDLDEKGRQIRDGNQSLRFRERARLGMFREYYHAYKETWAQCVAEAKAAGIGMRAWLYRGFWWNTIRQVPSTSAGLIIFELVRRKYGLGGDQVKISQDGYDILLR